MVAIHRSILMVGLFLGSVAATNAQQNDQPEPDSRYYYYVEGARKGGVNLKSEKYDNPKRAFEEKWRWLDAPETKDHPFTSGPTVMSVNKDTGKSEPAQPVPIDPMKPTDRPGETGTKDAKPLNMPPNKKITLASPLAGKKATGRIGDVTVTMEFKPNKKFKMTGDPSETSTWEPTDKGVIIRTPLATFIGSIKGDTVTGQRIMKDGSIPLTEWSVTLQVPQKAKLPTTPLPPTAAKADVQKSIPQPVETRFIVMFRQYRSSEGGWGGWLSGGGYGSYSFSDLASYKTGTLSRQDAEKAVSELQARNRRDLSLDNGSYPAEFKIVESK